MAPEPQEKQEQDQQRQQPGQHDNAVNADATQREAYHYWGYLLKQDKCGTPLLDRLLKGIAQVISHKFEPSDSTDITPSQIAAWYRDVGGNYDVLFQDTPATSIAFIYRSLGAFHSLQPGPNDDGYASPAIPALKKQGFVTWQTIQLLLGPEEHVPFLQKTVEKYDVVDPDTGSTFPKILPKQCFPDKPDEAMEAWYEGVADRLKREAEEEAARERAAKQAGGRTSTDLSGDGSSADEKTGAFKYFEDPMYRRTRARPTFMRHVSKQQAIYPIDDRGGARAVTQRVRHMFNPFHSKRRPSMPGRYESDDYSDEDATPVAVNPPMVVPNTSHQRQHERRQQNSLSTTDSDSEGERAPSRSKRPDIYQRRSHEPMPPREYFPPYYEGDRRNSHQQYPSDSRPSSKATSPQQVWRPTTSPLFATQVAQMEARGHLDRRPAIPQGTSYRPLGHGVRWGAGSTPVRPPRAAAPSHGHERSYDSRNGDDQARHRRRSTEDAAYPLERDEAERARTRSHDRFKDEWDNRDGSRSRQREARWDEDSDDYVRSTDDSRERDHDRRRHVAGVQGGVTGRRYPVVNSGLGGPY